MKLKTENKTSCNVVFANPAGSLTDIFYSIKGVICNSDKKLAHL